MLCSQFRMQRHRQKQGADIFEKLKKGTDPADIEDVNIPFKIVTKDNVADYLSK